MRIIRSASLALVVFGLLSGCSSPASQIKYYELNSATDLIYTSPIKNQKQVMLMSLQVPDYMRQSKLVMRTAPNTMHFSANNLWAQLPEKEFYSALIMDLNRLNSDLTFVSNKGPVTYKGDDASLVLEITHFYPTEESEVVLNGYWTLNEIESGNNATVHRSSQFSISLPLNEDGFAHAVGQQRRLISWLAEEILVQINSQ